MHWKVCRSEKVFIMKFQNPDHTNLSHRMNLKVCRRRKARDIVLKQRSPPFHCSVYVALNTMAEALEDDLESSLPAESEPEPKPAAKRPKAHTTECEEPGCIETADDPCRYCHAWYCHDHFARCIACQAWPLCAGCLRPAINHECAPADSRILRKEVNQSPENMMRMHRTLVSCSSSFRKIAAAAAI